MIKINLIDSVTDRSKGVAAVEQKVANPRMQTLLLAVVIASLLILAMGYDYLGTRAARAAAQSDLEKEQRTAAQMAAINKEQAELEQKTKDIQVRIDAIQKLRAAQQGPGMVLTAIKERIDGIPGVYLESVEQKGNELQIKGGSPNEVSVTRFGQSLEFSSGLFTNLNIETQRKVLEATADSDAGSADPNAPKTEMVNFTIKCNYNSQTKPSQPSAAGTGPAANQVAKS